MGNITTGKKLFGVGSKVYTNHTSDQASSKTGEPMPRYFHWPTPLLIFVFANMAEGDFNYLVF